MYQRKVCRKGQPEASITVFLSLILVLILSFLFSLLEAARVKGLQELTEQKLALQLESAFGDYNSDLWERYRILLLDGSFRTGKLDISRLEGHIMEESGFRDTEENMYRMFLRDIEIDSYMTAADQGGNAYLRQAVLAGKEASVRKVTEQLKEKIIRGGELQEKSGQLKELWKNAENAGLEVEEKKAEEEQKEDGQEKDDLKEEGTQGGNTEGELPENPMEYAALLKRSALLSLVAGDGKEISAKAVSLENTLEKRQLYCGNMKQKTEGAVDKLWFLQYLNTYFGCQQDVKAGEHALDYELEYCIGGKEQDLENLEQVLRKILLLREAGNFIAIMQDGEKQALAGNMALAIAGFTGIVPLIEAVKYGILLAWSYVESILDLRCLLAGGKVSLIKKTAEWRSDLFHLKDTMAGGSIQGNQEGMGYREYLLVLLALTPEKTLVYRSMDMIEQNLRLRPGQGKFRMDTMIAAVKAEAVYTAKGLFFHLFPGKRKWDNTYYLKAEKTMAYQK